MKKVKGNLIKLAELGRFDAIVHGCNCFHTMGAGIAGQIAQQYPEALEADKTSEYGSRAKLGSYTFAIGDHETEDGEVNTFYIINGYTQFTPGSGSLSYFAIEQLFKTLAVQLNGKKIGIPMIGAGIAGGDWEKIKKIINKEMKGQNITLVEWDGK